MAIAKTIFAFLALMRSICGAPLPADQAQAHIGEIATVQGRVNVRRTFDGETYLYVGGTGPTAPFSAYVSRRNAVKFQDVDHLDGKEVQITGRIAIFRDKPEIFLTDPGQIAAK